MLSGIDQASSASRHLRAADTSAHFPRRREKKLPLFEAAGSSPVQVHR